MKTPWSYRQARGQSLASTSGWRYLEASIRDINTTKEAIHTTNWIWSWIHPHYFWSHPLQYFEATGFGDNFQPMKSNWSTGVPWGTNRSINELRKYLTTKELTWRHPHQFWNFPHYEGTWRPWHCSTISFFSVSNVSLWDQFFLLKKQFLVSQKTFPTLTKLKTNQRRTSWRTIAISTTFRKETSPHKQTNLFTLLPRTKEVTLLGLYNPLSLSNI